MTGWLIAGAGTVIAALAGMLWAALKLGARADARANEAEAYRKTRERIDHAGKDIDGASDADVAERLRRHADQ